MSQQTLQPDTIDADITCARCGYNLRGLLTTGCCPECALKVVESVDKARRRRMKYGIPLAVQAAGWQRRVGYGFGTFLAAGFGEIALVYAAGFRGGHQIFALLLVVASYIGMWLGVWLFTLAPVGEVGRSTVLRRITRATMTTACAYLVVYAMMYLIHKPAPRISWDAMIFWGFNAVTTIAAFAYLADVAVRLERRRLSRVCACMSGMAFMFLLGTGEAAGWINFRFLSMLRLFPPDLPIIGSAYKFPYRLVTLGFFKSGFWSELLEDLWMPCSVAVLIWFAILFMRLAGREDLPRNSDASSRP